MNPYTDNAMAQIDAVLDDEPDCKSIAHVAHARLRDGTFKRFDVEATDPADGRAKVFARFPPRSVESVSCWPKHSQQVRDALTLRVGPTPIFDSAFGALV